MALPVAAGAAVTSMLGGGAGAGALSLLGGPVGIGLMVGTTLISGILNYMSSSSTQKKNEELYNKEYAQKQAAEQRNFDETKRVNDFDMNETLETKGYNRIQSAYQRGAALWSQQINAQNSMIAPLIGRK